MKSCSNTVIRAVAMVTALGWLLSMTASAGPWWVTNSTLKYKVDLGIGAVNAPHYWNKDDHDQFLFAMRDTKGQGALFSIPTLKDAVSSNGVAPIVSGTDTNFYGTPWKSGAISYDLGRVLTANGNDATHASLPVTSPWTKDVTVFATSNAPATGFDSLDFSHDSQYVYSDSYTSGTRSNLWKWNVVSLTNNGVGLTSNAVFATSVKRMRNLSVYYIGGKDLVYYGEGDVALAGAAVGKVYVWNTVTSNETQVCANLSSNDIMNVKVGGIGLGQMHLYVQHDTGTVEILNLAADGMSATLVKTFTRADMNNLLGETLTFFRSFEVTDDENYAFLGHHGDNGTNTWLNVVWSPGLAMAVLGINGVAITNNEAASAAKGTFMSFPFDATPVTNTFMITNTGNGTLTISGCTTNGTGASSFAIAGIPATIVAGTASNFSVIFTPSSSAESFSASLSISNDSAASPFVLNLAMNKAPPTPTGVAASDGTYTDKVRVMWDAVSGPASYEVWRNTSSNFSSATMISSPALRAASLEDTSATADATYSFRYDDASATTGISYYYWVKAVNTAGASSFSTSDTGYLGVLGPVITANGLLGNVYLNSGDPVTLAIQMMNVDPSCTLAVDWWIIAYAQTGQWYYMNNLFQWTYFNGNLHACHPVYQGRLVNLGPAPVLSGGILGAGAYTFWFAIDYPMNGILNGNMMLYDSVNVIVQ